MYTNAFEDQPSVSPELRNRSAPVAPVPSAYKVKKKTKHIPKNEDKYFEPESALGSNDSHLFGGFLPQHKNPGTLSEAQGQSQHADGYDLIERSETQRPPASVYIGETLTGLIPIPGAGSVIPYFFVTLAVYIIIRDVWITLAFALVWAYLDALFYFFLRSWNIPVWWPAWPGGARRRPSTVESAPVARIASYDRFAVQVVLVNPLYAVFGLLTAVFSVAVFSLDQMRDSCSLCWQVFVQAILLFFLVVHQGEHISWCLHAFGAPVYILLIAIWNNAYSTFRLFAPHLFLTIAAVFLATVWFVSNVLIHLGRFRTRTGRVFILSIQGTYAWSVFFSVTTYIFIASMIQFIRESS